MADSSLNIPVTVAATRIDATLLPPIFSMPYQLYVIQNGMDFGNVAGKANDAGQGAYNAQVRNDEQDVILADHEQRIEQAEATLVNHEGRITANTDAISLLTVRVTTAEGQIVTLQSDVNFLLSEVIDVQADMVSKSATSQQLLSSPLGVVDELLVDGIKVIGPQQTGWIASAGTAFKGAFNADQTFTAAAIYTQSDIQVLCDALKEARQRIKALEDVDRTHGLIN
ncbi:hypothetical protein [Yersinia intermedia]|uniref:hypothetical protein n=1 Tax=Yersinia intermedia TaxID=631 RepID=UPI0005DB4EA1|nr:hypothetical protein [Yersinia intermedia]CNE35648.1 Uncharacterised protein [Yersinia intermedia]